MPIFAQGVEPLLAAREGALSLFFGHLSGDVGGNDHHAAVVKQNQPKVVPMPVPVSEGRAKAPTNGCAARAQSGDIGLETGPVRRADELKCIAANVIRGV
jgi:hypothetical protein